jgi:hypothetical protein
MTGIFLEEYRTQRHRREESAALDGKCLKMKNGSRFFPL